MCSPQRAAGRVPRSAAPSRALALHPWAGSRPRSRRFRCALRPAALIGPNSPHHAPAAWRSWRLLRQHLCEALIRREAFQTECAWRAVRAVRPNQGGWPAERRRSAGGAPGERTQCAKGCSATRAQRAAECGTRPAARRGEHRGGCPAARAAQPAPRDRRPAGEEQQAAAATKKIAAHAVPARLSGRFTSEWGGRPSPPAAPTGRTVRR